LVFSIRFENHIDDFIFKKSLFERLLNWLVVEANFELGEAVRGMSVHSMHSSQVSQTNASRVLLLGCLGALLALAAFSDPLMNLVDQWSTFEEYSHGFLIPIVTLWLLWVRREALATSVGRPVWTGPALMLLAITVHLIGETSAIPILSQVGFVVALLGLILSLGGYSLGRAAIIPILFLLFAIPMPNFIYSIVSLQLQLVSSQLGAFFIRSVGIPVYLEGNVIDLGYYQIQIVEACSGLRYIYPLLSLGFLAAYFLKGPLWQRALVFFSVVPIAIVMNSIRIALVAVTVNHWGSQAADGVLHLFEGWFVFLICGCVLVLEIYLLARIVGKPFFEVFSLPEVSKAAKSLKVEAGNKAPAVASLVLLCVTAVAVVHISTRPEIIPDRLRFVAFPERLGPWQGRALTLEPNIERILRPDDYLLSDYKTSDGKIVNFYVAYYASQRKNYKPHSPGDCIPANGWNITNFRRTSYVDSEMNWPLNRVVIERNATKQLVYYWFDEQGRKVANEYLARWYLHVDAAVANRTDGALIRLVTQVYSGESEDQADQRLQAFIRDVMPTASGYLPSGAMSRIKSADVQ
jgi:exosortase D (VPLPA-CTERM-specific)